MPCYFVRILKCSKGSEVGTLGFSKCAVIDLEPILKVSRVAGVAGVAVVPDYG